MITEGGEAMDMLLEFIMELVMEGTVYTAQNKKVSLWIRIPPVSYTHSEPTRQQVQSRIPSSA